MVTSPRFAGFGEARMAAASFRKSGEMATGRPSPYLQFAKRSPTHSFSFSKASLPCHKRRDSITPFWGNHGTRARRLPGPHLGDFAGQELDVRPDLPDILTDAGHIGADIIAKTGNLRPDIGPNPTHVFADGGNLKEAGENGDCRDTDCEV